MKRFLSFIKKDWQIKLVAVGIAALLWFFVIAQENPTRVKEYDGIPVVYTGMEVLTERGLCLTDSPEDIVDSVRVAVEAPMDVLQSLAADDITATLDFSDITVAGETTLSVRVRSSGGSVAAVTPSKVNVSVENLATKTLPLEIQVIGNDTEELYYGEVSAETDTIAVAGSQSEIESYVKAMVVVDVTGRTESVKESKTVTLMTESGRIITGEEYDGVLPSVIVEVPIYPTKVLSLDAEELASGVTGVAEGCEITNVALSETKVTVAAPKDVLAGITEITLEEVELDNAEYDATVQIAVGLPESAVAVTPGVITATFQISEIKEEKLYEAVDITVKNLGSGFAYTISPQSVNVTVRGTKEELGDVTLSDIKPFVDLTGLGAGVHAAVIKFEGNADIGAVLTPSSVTVEVTITEE